MATESMGHIYDRRLEHLGVSDMGVIAVRRRLLKAIEALERGDPLPHAATDAEAPLTHIDTIAELIPSAETWREHFAHLTLEAPPAAQA